MENNFIIDKKYPENWNIYSLREKTKKEKEFNIVSFLLNDLLIKDFFNGATNLCIEFYEEPDFLVYSCDKVNEKIGLEIVQCYADDRRYNSLRIIKDLKKICKEVVDDIHRGEYKNISPLINYIDVTFSHEIMVGVKYDKNEIKAELKDAVLDKDQIKKKYVNLVKVGYSILYPKNSLKISINSDMLYLIPDISEIVLEQKGNDLDNCDPVRRCISVKEEKLINYKTKCPDCVCKWWLCIEVPKEGYMNPISYRLPENFISKYDKIFLMTRSFYGYGVRLIYGS